MNSSLHKLFKNMFMMIYTSFLMEKNFFLKIFRRFFCDIKSVFAKYNYSWSSATLFPFTALCDKCPHSELFWSVFSRIWTEYGEILRISPCSIRMRENTDQNNSEYGHFLCSAVFLTKLAKTTVV